jgi:hypothetical protein
MGGQLPGFALVQQGGRNLAKNSEKAETVEAGAIDIMSHSRHLEAVTFLLNRAASLPPRKELQAEIHFQS